MNMLLRQGRFLAGLGALAFLALTLTSSPLPRAQAQYGRSPRVVWVYDDGNRDLRVIGRGQWAEYWDDRQRRVFEERNRTPDYVEIYTDNPQPTWVRMHPDRVWWRTVGDPSWRPGRSGGWVDR
jgi:hypothetical protein